MNRASVGVIVVVLLGCGGGASLTPEEYSDQFDIAVCDYYTRCGTFADFAECAEFFEFEPLSPEVLSALEDGSLLFDGSAAAECIDAIDNLGCRVVDTQEISPACEATWEGALANGAICYRSYQCATEHCTVPTDCTLACCAGTCRDLPVVGQACPNSVCADGLYCDFLGDDTCKTLKGLSEPCEWELECASEYTCLSDGLASLCLPRPEVGESCAGDLVDARCADWSASCAASMTCEQFLYRGDACDPQDDLCSSFSSWCDPATSLCAELPGPGELCAAFRCRPGAYCDTAGIDDLCLAERAVGEACTTDRECASFNCDDVTFRCDDVPNCIATEEAAAARSRAYSIGTWSAQRR